MKTLLSDSIEALYERLSLSEEIIQEEEWIKAVQIPLMNEDISSRRWDSSFFASLANPRY